ncbi:MAG: polysaccharide deacetylase family protein [Ignavibacteria bacterium]|nr:polysaccharide deacetylase family protein [Ignavibacteria bacterium]
MKYFSLCFATIFLFSSCGRQNNIKITQIKNDTSTSVAKKSGKFQQGVVFHGNPDDKKIALTFDADMTESMLNKSKKIYNHEIEDILRKNNVKATIFVAGLWAELYWEQLKKLANDTLFEIGNHSFSHKSFTDNCFGLKKLYDSEKEEDILKAQETIKRITGNYPSLFRFPGGCYTAGDVELVNKLGLTVIHWDVISGDAVWKNPRKIIQNVLNKSKNGSIIVMHFPGNRRTSLTAESLQIIIDELKKKRFEIVKVSELIM